MVLSLDCWRYLLILLMSLRRMGLVVSTGGESITFLSNAEGKGFIFSIGILGLIVLLGLANVTYVVKDVVGGLLLGFYKIIYERLATLIPL